MVPDPLVLAGGVARNQVDVALLREDFASGKALAAARQSPRRGIGHCPVPKRPSPLGL